MNLRPLSDRILVELDPMKEESKGGIILVGDKSTEAVRTGTVVRVGPGKKAGHARAPLGVEIGEKVAFFRWHQEHQQGKQMTHVLGPDHVLIKAEDVLFAFDKSVAVEVN